jgi:hypothetical protein
MCSGGRRLCDFIGGTAERPEGLPGVVKRSLTQTTDGRWIVWAYKIAYRSGDCFTALTGYRYSADARAECRRDAQHVAPDPACTCGFHAVSDPDTGVLRRVVPSKPSKTRDLSALLDRIRRRIAAAPFSFDRPVLLTVALSGRVLAFDYASDSVLFRAERQTVLRVDDPTAQPPDDPAGTREQLMPRHPTDVGPVRLALPNQQPATVTIADDAGFCLLTPAPVTTAGESRSDEDALVICTR